MQHKEEFSSKLSSFLVLQNFFNLLQYLKLQSFKVLHPFLVITIRVTENIHFLLIAGFGVIGGVPGRQLRQNYVGFGMMGGVPGRELRQNYL